jgi:hypothetical protein
MKKPFVAPALTEESTLAHLTLGDSISIVASLAGGDNGAAV